MIKNSILIILGLFLIHSNSSEAFLWGLTQEEKSICRNRASKKQNSFSAKKAYDFCKKNIKKDKSKEKKYKYCMNKEAIKKQLADFLVSNYLKAPETYGSLKDPFPKWYFE